MSSLDVDISLTTLSENKQRWAALPIVEKIALLDTLHHNTVAEARSWVEAAVAAKGLSMDEPVAGEEWLGGPFAFLLLLRDLRTTLVRLSTGVPVLDGYSIEERGRTVAVDVFPMTSDEAILFSGVTAEVRMQPGITADTLDDHVASIYRSPPGDGRVTVVLGAGNVASIAPMDAVHALYTDGSVVCLKMNPVNDYLGPILEKIFASFVAEGFIRLEYGGAEAGQLLTNHEQTDAIHITGSERSYYAIVYGDGDEGAKRRADDTPIIDAPVSAELGGVSPVIVVPGPWTDADIRFQAEHIVSMKMNNSGFNCVAAQVLILPERWDHADALLEEIGRLMAEIDDRPPYYPGSEDRTHGAATSSDSYREYGSDGSCRYVIDGIETGDDSMWFTSEIFGPALAVTRIDGSTPADFLRNAVEFSNERLVGTLGANILIDPKTRRANEQSFSEAIDDLVYGTIAINSWTGVAYSLPRCAWGAAPVHTRSDVGSGIGFVHNTLMFDAPAKSVVYGPFAPSPRSFLKGERHLSPKPIYFVGNKRAHEVGEKLIAYLDEPTKARLSSVAWSALRG